MHRQTLLLFLLFLRLSTTTADDGAVMLKLANSLNPLPSGWSTTSSLDFCQWNHVACDTSNKVATIDLSDMNVNGTLPPELTSLTHLRYLYLQNNHLSGNLPSFSNSSNLRSLRLDVNDFTSIPSGFFQGLVNLQVFNISMNNLDPWRLTVDLAESTSLTTFIANASNIVGSIPDIFGSLPKLQNLMLSYNKLSGPLPPSMAKSGIQTLRLNNQGVGLTGTINVLNSMAELSQVWLHENQFTGPIPDLSNCKSLFDLQLRDNNLKGIVPSSLVFLPSLMNVSLSNNKLQGSAPVFPTSVITDVDNGNNFCADSGAPCAPQVIILLQIAEALGYPEVLSDGWDGNRNECDWDFLTCDTQNKVITVNLAKQNLIGTISPACANLSSLKNLYLNDNNLTGSIPHSLTNLTQFAILDVSNNNLSGKVPNFLSSVKIIVTPGNDLLQQKPTTVYISVQANMTVWSGGAPGANGTASREGAQRANGPAPGRSAQANMTVWSGGAPGANGTASREGAPRANGPAPGGGAPGARTRSSKIGWQLKLVIATLTTVTMTIIVAISVIYFTGTEGLSSCKAMAFWKKNKKRCENIETFIMNFHSLIPKRYSYLEVKKMTNSFVNKLGQGGFACVYKGKLQDGRLVAVKVLNKSKGDGEEFINEVASIGRTSHVNIVSLIGFCYERTKKALIYEYMPNGSLDKFVYHEKLPHSNRQLEWKTLYEIAIGIARGLEYLHRGCNARIVHFDIKPHNILLDEDFCPKISDFGLAKLCKRKESRVSMMGTRGTIGYIAPEVYCRNLGGASYKSDVYSYGMMVLEMVGGRKNIYVEVSNTSEIYFPDWIYNHLESGEVLNSRLYGYITHEEEEMAKKMIIVGLWCIQTNPSHRPSMTNVAEMLEGSLQSLQIPPRPFFSSPTRSPQVLPSSASSSLLGLPQREEDKVSPLDGGV